MDTNDVNLESLNSLSEVSNYHDTSKFGFFSILIKTATETKQLSYSLNKLDYALSKVDPNFDTWISQNEFNKPNRRIVNLLRLNLLYLDIDTYKMEWSRGKSPQQLADSFIYFCREELIPEPSVIIYSGRGIQVKWLFNKSLPRGALPRWNACQRSLVEKMGFIGADPAAKDASRVLRLINTTNTKSGNTCYVINILEENHTPKRYDFEYLCECLLPVARLDIEKQRQTNLEKAKSNHKGTANLRKFNKHQLAWDRLEDLRKLREIRGGIVPEGERMLHLFWTINFLLLSKVTSSKNMFHEAVALAKEIDPNWDYRSQELSTLYHKAKDYEAGKTIKFAGKEYPALYTPRNSTLINLFKITAEEQKQLRTIISKELALELRRKRDEKRRRKKGAIPRAEYLKAAALKHYQIIALKNEGEGLSIRAIAAILGVSKSTVAQYIEKVIHSSVQSPPLLLMA